MAHVELIADSDVVSYIYKREPRGLAFSDLIGGRPTGITLLSVAESRKGAVYADWGDRQIARLHAFLSRFFVVEFNAEIANVCRGLLGRGQADRRFGLLAGCLGCGHGTLVGCAIGRA